MHIAIDIDGTLCWSNVPVFLQECNTSLGLHIEQEQLDQIKDKASFFALPEVQALRSTHPHLDDEIGWIEFRERCLLESLPMDGAAEGVRHLMNYGDIHYCTARYCCIPEWQEEIERGTTRWLEKHQFPEWSNVSYCNRIKGKIHVLLKIAEQDSILLVDDSYAKIITLIRQLPQPDYHLLSERLLLIAMRAETIPETSLNVIPLKSWKHLETSTERIRDHGHYTKTAA